MEPTTATSEVESVVTTGLLELIPDQGGRLRSGDDDYRCGEDDVFVPQSVIRDAKLRGGEIVTGPVLMPSARQRGLIAPQLQSVTQVEGLALVDWMRRSAFDDLSIRDSDTLLGLERANGPIAMRIIDLFAPIGFGHSVVVVAPPKTGQTILLQQLTTAAKANHEGLEVIFLLVDERPEEVTDRKRSLPVPVLASGSDLDAANHVRLARLAFARAKRRVEVGQDVLIVVDSLTRLTRALNCETRRRGGVLDAALDEQAIEEAQAMLGASRNVDGPGSLTVVASVQVDTGSDIDTAIYQRFAGRAETEIVLSSRLAASRTWPAIDVCESGTSSFENILSEEIANVVAELRETAEAGDRVQTTKKLFGNVRAYDSNEELVASRVQRRKR